MSPVSEFTPDFCAGIGPLQLGVMLVLFSFTYFIFLIRFWSRPAVSVGEPGQQAQRSYDCVLPAH